MWANLIDRTPLLNRPPNKDLPLSCDLSRTAGETEFAKQNKKKQFTLLFESNLGKMNITKKNNLIKAEKNSD